MEFFVAEDRGGRGVCRRGRGLLGDVTSCFRASVTSAAGRAVLPSTTCSDLSGGFFRGCTCTLASPFVAGEIASVLVHGFEGHPREGCRFLETVD